jgi:hypothetical protein
MLSEWWHGGIIALLRLPITFRLPGRNGSAGMAFGFRRPSADHHSVLHYRHVLVPCFGLADEAEHLLTCETLYD